MIKALRGLLFTPTPDNQYDTDLKKNADQG